MTGVLEDVRGRGDAALRDYTARFDGVELASPLAVPGETLRRALEASSAGAGRTLSKAAENVREYHSREAPRPWRAQLAQGQTVGQEIMPMAVAGLYVPGGLADYPSSVLMTAVPAQVAGVETHRRLFAAARGRLRRLPASPPPARCSASSTCSRSGGAQAVAAMAFGTESVPRCDVSSVRATPTSPRPSVRSWGTWPSTAWPARARC